MFSSSRLTGSHHCVQFWKRVFYHRLQSVRFQYYENGFPLLLLVIPDGF